jgi:hypothetical protein
MGGKIIQHANDSINRCFSPPPTTFLCLLSSTLCYLLAWPCYRSLTVPPLLCIFPMWLTLPPFLCLLPGYFWLVAQSANHLLMLVHHSWTFLRWKFRRYIPLICQFTQDLHSATSQKMAFFLEVYSFWDVMLCSMGGGGDRLCMCVYIYI